MINGGGRRQTTFTIDGSGADDSWGRQSIFTNIPVAAVQEFTVLTNSFSAEYGRSTGGAVNLVTRTGTNDLRADVTFTARPGGLQANTPVTDQEAHDELWQGSAVASGALVHDRAHWAAGAEYTDQQRDSVITSALSPGVFTGKFKQTLLFARFDGDINAEHHWLARAERRRSRRAGSRPRRRGSRPPRA